MDAQGFDENKPVGGKLDDDKAADIWRRWEYLRGRRGTWENHWTEIAQRMYPMDSFLFHSLQNLSTQGDKRNNEILDSTAVLALQRFGAILDSLLTPRNQFWHQIKPSNRTLLKDKSTMDWFEKVNTILFEQRYAPNANFASQNQMQYLSLGAYGTGNLFIDDLAGAKGIRYKNVHLSETYLQENHQGLVDTVYRHFMLTAKQAVDKFGANLPDTITARAERQPEDPTFFIHCVEPRSNVDYDRKDFKGMKYASYYISLEGKKMCAEGGYTSFPYATSRYSQAPQEPYGRSPAMDVLPAVKTLNKQKELILKQGQLAVDPVMLVHDDGIMDGASIESGTFISGAISADGRMLAQPMPVGRLEVGKELMEEERKIINDAFLVNLFQILTETPEMTATEVMERTREKGILLAPTIGRQQSEYLGPLVDREIDILNRQGLLPPMPPFLKQAKGEYSIVYDSPITRTAKAEWAAGATRTFEILLNVAQQTQDPSPLFYINWDIAAPAMADIYGTPASWLNSPEKVQELKAQLQKTKQQQMAIQAAPAAAGVLKAVQ